MQRTFEQKQQETQNTTDVIHSAPVLSDFDLAASHSLLDLHEARLEVLKLLLQFFDFLHFRDTVITTAVGIVNIVSTNAEESETEIHANHFFSQLPF